MFGLRSPGFLSAAKIDVFAGNIRYAGLPPELSGAPADLKFNTNLRLETHGRLTPYDKWLMAAPSIDCLNNTALDYTIVSLKTSPENDPFIASHRTGAEFLLYYKYNTAPMPALVLTNMSSTSGIVPLSARLDSTNIKHYIDQSSSIPFFTGSNLNSLTGMLSPFDTSYDLLGNQTDRPYERMKVDTTAHLTASVFQLRSISPATIQGFAHTDKSLIETGGDKSVSPSVFNIISGGVLDDLASYYNGRSIDKEGVFTDPRLQVYYPDNQGGVGFTRTVNNETAQRYEGYRYIAEPRVHKGLWGGYRKRNVIGKPILLTYGGVDCTVDYLYDTPSIQSILSAGAHSAPTISLSIAVLSYPWCRQPTWRQNKDGSWADPHLQNTAQDCTLGYWDDPCSSPLTAAPLLGAPMSGPTVGRRSYIYYVCDFNTTGYNPYIYQPVLFKTSITRQVGNSADWSPDLRANDIVLVPEKFLDPTRPEGSYTYAIRKAGERIKDEFGQEVSINRSTLRTPSTLNSLLSSYRFSKISLGSTHIIGLTTSGQLVTLGDNENFQTNTPYTLAGYNNILDIAAGNTFSVILSSNGLIYAWGGGIVTTTTLSGVSRTLFTGFSSGGHTPAVEISSPSISLSAVKYVKIYSTPYDTLIALTSAGELHEMISPSTFTTTIALSAIYFLSPNTPPVSGTMVQKLSALSTSAITSISVNQGGILLVTSGREVIQWDRDETPYDTSRFVSGVCVAAAKTRGFNNYVTTSGVISSFAISSLTGILSISGIYTYSTDYISISGLSAVDIRRFEINEDAYAVLFSNSTVGVVSGLSHSTTFLSNISSAISINTSHCSDRSSTLAVILSGGEVRFFGEPLSTDRQTLSAFEVGGNYYYILPTIAIDPRTRQVISRLAPERFVDRKLIELQPFSDDPIDAEQMPFISIAPFSYYIPGYDYNTQPNYNCSDLKRIDHYAPGANDFYTITNPRNYEGDLIYWDNTGKQPMYTTLFSLDKTKYFQHITGLNGYEVGKSMLTTALWKNHARTVPMLEISEYWWWQQTLGGNRRAATPEQNSGWWGPNVITTPDITSTKRYRLDQCPDSLSPLTPLITIRTGTSKFRTSETVIITPALAPREYITGVPLISGTTKAVTVTKSFTRVAKISKSPPPGAMDCCICPTVIAAFPYCDVTLNTHESFETYVHSPFISVPGFTLPAPEDAPDEMPFSLENNYSITAPQSAQEAECARYRAVPGNCGKKTDCPLIMPLYGGEISFSG